MAEPTITRNSVEIPIEWDKGSTFRQPFYWTDGPTESDQTPVNLANCTAAMHLRHPDNGTLYHEMTTENGGIELEPVSYSPTETGVIEVYISASDLAGFSWNVALYDLEIYFLNTDVRKLVRGTFLLYEEQTVTP